MVVMDREEALKLLKGGPEGVKEWNKQWGGGEEIPSLEHVDLRLADLSGADLSIANLRGANLSDAMLSDANLARARMYVTNIACDLREARGLDRVNHRGPSSVDVNTLRDFNHSLPERFLRGCGLTPYDVLVARMLNP